MATCGPWLEAAAQFRRALTHASNWLHAAAAPGTSRGRRLTQHDMQSLYAYFARAGQKFDTVTPTLVGMRSTASHPVKRYFAWMKEDALLAKQVADAWGDIVQRGEADTVKCKCRECSPDSGFRWY